MIARSTSEAATGCTELLRIHVGTGCTRNNVAICRMISNDVDPAPITTPARSATAPSVAPRRMRSTSSRDAMWADEHASPGLYFGARNGAVWASSDAGETWAQIVSDLPDVMCVRAAAIEG